MVKRSVLALVVVTILIIFLGVEARAAVCLAKLGGKCVYWSGSVECGIAASGLGKCIDTTLGCYVEGKGMWAVACGNPGTNSWTSPGIQVVYFEGSLGGALTIDPKVCDKNGNAFVTVYADPDAVLYDALWQAGACPNPNWYPRDAVPCTMTATDQEIDADGCVVADATFTCVLPNCETLGWDKKNQKFERRQYGCTRTCYNRYSVPICANYEPTCPTAP